MHAGQFSNKYQQSLYINEIRTEKKRKYSIFRKDLEEKLDLNMLKSVELDKIKH